MSQHILYAYVCISTFLFRPFRLLSQSKRARSRAYYCRAHLCRFYVAYAGAGAERDGEMRTTRVSIISVWNISEDGARKSLLFLTPQTHIRGKSSSRHPPYSCPSLIEIVCAFRLPLTNTSMYYSYSYIYIPYIYIVRHNCMYIRICFVHFPFAEMRSAAPHSLGGIGGSGGGCQQMQCKCRKVHCAQICNTYVYYAWYG